MNEKKSKALPLVLGILIGVMVTAIIGGIACTKAIDYVKEQYENAYQTAIDNLVGDTDLNLEDTSVINQEVVDQVNLMYKYFITNFYYSDRIDVEKMRDSIYRAIIATLDDPYAEYYNPDEFAEFFDDSEGVYYGIGSYVQKDEDTGYVLLSGIFDDSPAEKAGLMDGDLIVAADGTEVKDLTLTEAVNIIKGPAGTVTVLTIKREGEAELLEIPVTRDKVESPTVTSEMMDNSIGYISLQRFEDVTSKQFEEAYNSLNKQGMKAMILDLRDNGGGNLSTVLDIGEMMLPRGVITYTEDKYGNKEEYYSTGTREIEIPVVVLTNGYTASASELLTGALRDYGKATVIGTNTYGKGIVQSIYFLNNSSGIKITTSSYFTPKGECFHGYGIAPDIELEFDKDAYYASDSKNRYDNQKIYAYEYLLKQIQ